MPNDPARGALEKQQEQDVRKAGAGLPRAFAHTVGDALKLAWWAGFDYAKATTTKGP